MAFGIDTFRAHLDLIDYTEFRTWNGATVSNGELVGGKPVFAGRNFLGGDFIWGHAESTNASSEPFHPDGAGGGRYPLPVGEPSPEHPENLTQWVDLVAPIQAAQPKRQQLLGHKGYIFGRIDGNSICSRLRASIMSGEMNLRESVFVWLSVDPTVPFSIDYWAGWSDQVNHFAFFHIPSGGPRIVQPFRACIICSFALGVTGKLEPEAQVFRSLATAASSYRGDDTICYALWADLERQPPLEWSAFSGTTMPLLWRFSHGFRNNAGVVVNDQFDVDATNPIAGIQKATDFMLEVQKWQPNVPTIQNPGFSNSDVITNAHATCLQTTDLPDMNDNNFHASSGHFHVPGGHVTVIGRYIRHGAVASLGRLEAQRLSDAGFTLFTCWQSHRPLAGVLRQPREIAYFNPDPDGNPTTHDDAGTLDGTEAFQYCGEVLKQLPQTPVFFALDFDPYDPPGALNEAWIKIYFERIKTARDDYSARTGRHYLIGVYGVGKIMKVLYAQGIVSHFWQAGSSGRSGSRPPNWPWFHTNRWQYQADKAICGIGGVSAVGKPFGIDPDADWGDGGTWSLRDTLSQLLEHLERFDFVGISVDWGILTMPLPPP